jgi:orotidine-5'-phosphate decarboxylase
MTQYWPFPGLVRNGSLRDRLIVSLDFGSRREALELVDRLLPSVRIFRVGKHLFINNGPEFIREIKKRGAEVFLDLKFHDTAREVCRRAIEATRLGAKMFDLHPYGSLDVMARTHLEVSRLCQAEGLRRPQILAVTMLTCLEPASTAGGDPLRRGLINLAKLAADASMDGVLTSPHETAALRATCGRRFVIVTAGVRMDSAIGAGTSDCTPAQAVRAGADYIVVGKPVWTADEPLRAVREIVAEMERGFRSGQRRIIEAAPTRTRMN